MHSPIYSPEEQKWKIRSNNQFKVLYKRENMVEIVRSTRIEWMGHVWRADPREKPHRRWMDGTQETHHGSRVDWSITRVDWNTSKNREK